MFPTRHPLTAREIAAVWPTATLLASPPVIDFGAAGSRLSRYGAVTPRKSRAGVRRLWAGLSALWPRLFRPRAAGVDGAQ